MWKLLWILNVGGSANRKATWLIHLRRVLAFCTLDSRRDVFWRCGDIATKPCHRLKRSAQPSDDSKLEPYIGCQWYKAQGRGHDGHLVKCGHTSLLMDWRKSKEWKCWNEGGNHILQIMGNPSWSMVTIIVGEIRHCKEVHPILLLVADYKPDVLFKDLVNSFGFAINLRMICCWQVHRSPRCLQKVVAKSGR